MLELIWEMQSLKVLSGWKYDKGDLEKSQLYGKVILIGDCLFNQKETK